MFNISNEHELKSKMVFRDSANNSEVSIHDRSNILAYAEGLSWQGIQLEVGNSSFLEADDVMIDGHFIGINLGSDPWHLDIRFSDQWMHEILPSRCFWIIPEGNPFSVHHRGKAFWAHAVIQGHFLDTVLGQHYELNGSFGIADNFLEHLFLALIEQTKKQNFPSEKLTKSVIQSFLLALAYRHGAPAAELLYKGGLAPRQLKSILKWIETNLGEPITVKEIAAKAGLSPAHFSREFRQSMGHTPWEYVMELRLQRVVKLLKTDESIGAIAAECGFFDQAHLARLFKKRFGLAPSAFIDRRSKS
jgi:AraC family transcriptional regulator